MYNYKAKITNVVDGDTFDMDIDLGFNIHINERIRLLEVDTPEKRGEKEEKELGLIVTDYARQQFLGKDVIILTEKSKKGTDSFGRWLAYVFVGSGDDGIHNLYNRLGVNKLSDSYSKENVLKLKEMIC